MSQNNCTVTSISVICVRCHGTTPNLHCSECGGVGYLNVPIDAQGTVMVTCEQPYITVSGLTDWLTNLTPDGLHVVDKDSGKRYIVTEIVEKDDKNYCGAV